MPTQGVQASHVLRVSVGFLIHFLYIALTDYSFDALQCFWFAHVAFLMNGRPLAHDARDLLASFTLFLHHDVELVKGWTSLEAALLAMALRACPSVFARSSALAPASLTAKLPMGRGATESRRRSLSVPCAKMCCAANPICPDPSQTFALAPYASSDSLSPSPALNLIRLQRVKMMRLLESFSR